MPYRDLERRRRYGRDWIRRNAEKAREAMRRWRASHPDEHAAEGRQFYGRHREVIGTKRKAYHAANPQVRRVASQRRRARERNAEGAYTTKEWLELLSLYDRRCAYCGAAGRLHADHRIPLSRGGTNHITNILPACPPCNLHKHRLTDKEFRGRLERDGRSGSESS